MSSHQRIAAAVGVLSFLVRIPFVFRYDLHFGGDSAICYLMALRIPAGDRPWYFYGQDYQGSPEAYAAALLLSSFGQSIPVAAIVSLIEWSIAAAIGATLVARSTSNRTTIAICGVAIVVGVPYTLHYVTVPYWGYPGSLLIAMWLLLQADAILRNGLSAGRAFVFGATAGLGLYVGKQCIPAIVAAVVAFAMSQRTKDQGVSWRRALVLCMAGWLVGYAPELWYRLNATETRGFVGTLDPSMIWSNAKFTVLSILAYFNAHPVSRLAEGTNFFRHFFSGGPEISVFPADPVDWLSAALAAAATLLAVVSLWAGRRNPPLLLLALLVVVNLVAVVFSNDTGGLFLSARRYLFTSAIAFSIWAGLLVAAAAQRRERWIRSAALAAGVIVSARVAVNEIELLRSPDELGELRRIASQMIEQGATYGLAPLHSDELVALTNERLKIISLVHARIPEYVEAAASEDRIVVVNPKSVPPGVVEWNGALYDQVGPAHQSEVLQWAFYQKRAQ